MGLVEQGAIAVRGNHDNAIGTPTETMNAVAQAAIEWTRGRLSAGAAALPRRIAADAGGGRSPLCPFRSLQSGALALCAVDRGCGAQHCRDRRAGDVLRPHPSARALFDVGDRQDDELRADVRRAACSSCGAGAGSPCSARSASRATAIRRPVLRPSTPRRARSPIAASPYDVETAAKRIRANGLPPWLAERLLRAGEPMAKSPIEPGAVLDGFTIGECVHHGGMATLWSVTHPGHRPRRC